MTLTLRAVSLNDRPLTQPITAHFDLQGGTIGRADDNTLALPDPERYISRQQAQISAGRRGYVIKNIGGANPIIVRNQALAQGESAELMHSDQVRIGGYLLEVIDDEVGDAAATQFPRGRGGGAPAEAKPDARAVPPFGDLAGPLSNSNPFAELLGTAPAPTAPMAPGAALPPRLPDNVDLFAVAPAPVPMPALDSDPFADLIPPQRGASIDEMFGLGPGRAGDPLDGFMKDASAPASSHALPPEVAPDHVPELRGSFTPPRPARVPPAPLPQAVAPEPAPIEADADAIAMWRAFCEGAGVRLPPQGMNSEVMRIVGLVMRGAIEGTLQLIAVRRETRHELRPADVTVIRPRENNPLKFSPDAQSALEQLLQPPMRGFLPGPVAMTDAMNDLVGHAIGTMAGTRAALEGVLARFAPAELEAKLAGKSMLDSLVPMNRKAKLWELYLQHHQAIRDEAQDDFDKLFARAFVAAYEQQVERLRRERKSSST